MNKEILKSILEASSIEFSYDEVNEMLEEELSKPVELMDTDLVDLCLEVLTGKKPGGDTTDKGAPVEKENSESSEGKVKTKKSIKKSRIFLIAAIVAILGIITVSAGADVFSVDAQNGIVCIFGKEISLNITCLKNKNVFEELKKQGLENVYLLPLFLEDTCELEVKEEKDGFHFIQFSFSDSAITGYISVRQDDNVKYNLESIKLYHDVEQVKQLIVESTDIIIVSTKDSKVMAYYNSDDCNYKVYFENSSFEETVDLLANCQVD